MCVDILNIRTFCSEAFVYLRMNILRRLENVTKVNFSPLPQREGHIHLCRNIICRYKIYILK